MNGNNELSDQSLTVEKEKIFRVMLNRSRSIWEGLGIV